MYRHRAIDPTVSSIMMRTFFIDLSWDVEENVEDALLLKKFVVSARATTIRIILLLIIGFLGKDL